FFSSSFIQQNNLKINEQKNINNNKLSTKITTKQRSAPERINKYPLVNLTTKNKINLLNEKFFNDEEEKLNNLVHENMERAEAELLLGAMPLGAHLLRRRPDKSLALSLKSNEGVLHIKLEYRCDRWVLGEGPRFNKVIEMLKAYRKVELPVRGAEQIRLSILFRPGDMPGNGLLLL
ncbi:SH2 domain-containing protein, partial [Meloidogyne graminicola]